MELGERLKKSRLNKGYSQKDVAELLHISRQAISKWENGNSYPDLDNLVKLSTHYEVTIEELLEENQELRKQIDKNESNCADKPKKLYYVQNKTSNDEGLMLLMIAFIGCLIPPVGFVIAPIVIKRNKKTNTLYKLVYFACVCCILLNLYAVYFTVGNYLGWGTTTVELIN